MSFSPASLMRKLGLEPDPWQVEVLEAGHPRLLLNCSRQAGKSTVVALLGLAHALVEAHALVLLLSRSHRQSIELFRIITGFLARLRLPKPLRQNSQELQLGNMSRIVSLPCKEETIRGYAHVDLLVIDEAARVPDDLYRAVRPMLAVSNGRLICLSTPYGKRGFFFDAWTNGGGDWARIEIPARLVPRITAAFLEQERCAMGQSWFRQEYDCSFEALEGLVYPDFARCLVPEFPPPLAVSRSPDPFNPQDPTVAALRHFGGIDFGFRNPFAAVWGVLDAQNVLWLAGEHYSRNKPLSYHARHLPRRVTWFADPAGANERAELRCAGFTIREGHNSVRPGIAAVSARLENGSLKILQGACPNLLAEAQLYRYSDDPREKSESPLDEHNHALAALRYLIASMDKGKMALTSSPTPTAPAPKKRQRDPWLRLDNPAIWTHVCSIPQSLPNQ